MQDVLIWTLWISMATALRPASPEPRLTSLERKLREGQETETSILRQSGIRRITSNHRRFDPLIRWSACRNRRSMPSSFVGLRTGKLCVGSWNCIIHDHPGFLKYVHATNGIDLDLISRFALGKNMTWERNILNIERYLHRYCKSPVSTMKVMSESRSDVISSRRPCLEFPVLYLASPVRSCVTPSNHQILSYIYIYIEGLPPMPPTPQCARKRPASRRDLNDPFHVP